MTKEEHIKNLRRENWQRFYARLKADPARYARYKARHKKVNQKRTPQRIAREKAWCDRNKDKLREYWRRKIQRLKQDPVRWASHLARRREYEHAWRKKNHARVLAGERARQAKFDKEHPGYRTEYSANFRASHPEYHVVATRKFRENQHRAKLWIAMTQLVEKLS